MQFFLNEKIALLVDHFVFYKSFPVCLTSSLPLHTHSGHVL